MSRVVTLGETLGLVRSATTGPLEHAGSLDLGIGGAESNVAIGVRRLGTPATWLGRVGADSFGTRVVRELRAEGLDVLAATDEQAPTALMVKERRTPTTTRVTYYRAGSAGSRLSPDDLPDDLLEGAGALHLTGITPGLADTALAATRHALTLAARAGISVSFDVNHRVGVWGSRDAATVYREVAAGAAVVFAGDDEARLLTGSTATDPGTLLDALATTTTGDVVLKLGADGCLARIDGTDHRLPAVPVTVVDTVGAGDAFVAGYLAELVAGLPPADRLATAVRCGALACTGPGDWESLPTRADLDALDAGGDPVRR